MKGQWYLNIQTNPKVEAILPSGQLIGYAEVVADPIEAANAMRQILKSSGLGGFVYGFNPFAVSDELILERTRGIPVVRITPTKNNLKIKM